MKPWSKRSSKTLLNPKASPKRNSPPKYHDVDPVETEATSFTSSIEPHSVERFRSICTSDSDTSGDESSSEYKIVWSPRCYLTKRDASQTSTGESNDFNSSLRRRSTNPKSSHKLLRTVSEGSHQKMLRSVF